MNKNVLLSVVCGLWSVMAAASDYSLQVKLQVGSAPVTFLVFDQNVLLVGNADGDFMGWDVTDLSRPVKLFEVNDHHAMISHIAVANDRWLTGGHDGRLLMYSKNGILLDSLSNEQVNPYDGANGNEVTFCLFSKDQNYILYGGYNRSVWKVDRSFVYKERIFRDTLHAVTSGQFYTKKQVTFSSGNTVYFLNPFSNRITTMLNVRSKGDSPGICEISVMDEYVVTSEIDGYMTIIPASKHHKVMRIKFSEMNGAFPVMNITGTEMLLTGGATDLTIWNVKTGERIESLSGHEETITALASEQSRQMIASGARGEVIIWGRKAQPVPVFEEQLAEFENIQFGRGSDRLPQEGGEILTELAEYLSDKTNARVKLTGHTESLGKLGHNMILSRKRAERCKDFLIRKGIAESRIVSAWFGPTQPLRHGPIRASPASNRRVEIEVIDSIEKLK